jgi:hypothetical protein
VLSGNMQADQRSALAEKAVAVALERRMNEHEPSHQLLRPSNHNFPAKLG